MLFRAYSPEKNIEEEVYASRISEAATKFAPIVFGFGWGVIKVFESGDGKSAIVLSPNKRPFKVESIR
jgi:hypothetical protein